MTMIGFQVQVNSQYMTSDISVQAVWVIVKGPEVCSLLGLFFLPIFLLRSGNKTTIFIVQIHVWNMINGEKLFCSRNFPKEILIIIEQFSSIRKSDI